MWFALGDGLDYLMCGLWSALRRPTAGLVMVLWPLLASAYPSDVHVKLTFLAVEQFNRCTEGGAVSPITPLQARFMARSSERQANRNVIRRMFQWPYYDRRQKERSVIGLVETRLHEHYNETVRAVFRSRKERERYQRLGVLVQYLQQVTVPAHVIPIYYGFPWRSYFTGDRFDSFPLNVELLEARMAGLCAALTDVEVNYEQLLTETAERTRAAVGEPIPGIAANWTRFWEDDGDPSDFGEYGPAGNNFGRSTRFRCRPGQRETCALAADDPAYRQFALARHLDAVRATMRAVWIIQQAAEADGSVSYGPRTATTEAN